MRKTLLLLISISFIGQVAQAQKRDTLLYYMNNDGAAVADKSRADYFLYIMPADRSSGKVLYPVYEYYPNGNRRLVSNSKNNTLKRLQFEGPCITYYPDGKKKEISNLKNGVALGELTQYYPNGKLYDVVKCRAPVGISLITCRDTAGNILADHGKGYWLKFNDDRDKLLSKGRILDSLEDGEWTGPVHDTGRFICLYKKGMIVSGTGYDRSGKGYPFTETTTEPVFKGKKHAFSDYVKQNLIYPKQVLEDHVQATIYVRITVEKYGVIKGVYTDWLYAPGDNDLSNDYKLMCSAAISVIKSSPPWVPGTLYGMPVRTKMTVPVNFNNH